MNSDNDFKAILSDLLDMDRDDIVTRIATISMDDLVNLIDAANRRDADAARRYLGIDTAGVKEGTNMRNKKPFGESVNKTMLEDLRRLQELAGMIPSAADSDIGAVDPVDDLDDAMNDLDDTMGMDGMDDAMGMDDIDPAPLPAPTPTPASPAPVSSVPPAPLPDVGGDSVYDHLDAVSRMLPEVKVTEFKTVVERLRALVTQALDLGRANLAEQAKRKTLRDYLEEDANQDDVSLGKNRNSAIDALNQRMGGKPQDRAKASKAFDKLKAKGNVKMNNGQFSMKAMGDDEFEKSLNEAVRLAGLKKV